MNDKAQEIFIEACDSMQEIIRTLSAIDSIHEEMAFNLEKFSFEIMKKKNELLTKWDIYV